MNDQTIEFEPGERVEARFQRDPSRALARAAIAHARCALHRSMRPDEYAAQAWGFDPDTALLLRAATTPTSMTNASALVRVLVAILPALAPQSAAAELFNIAPKLQFGPEASSFVVPGVIPPNGAFVGEGLPKPVGQGLSSGPTMAPAKIASIVVASAELLAQAAPEELIRQMLAESAGPALDAAVFSAAAGSTVRPPGLLNGIAATPDASPSGTTYDALLADLGALAAAVGGVAGNGGITFVAAIPQAVTAKLSVQPIPDYRIFASSAIAAGTVIAIANNAIASAIGVPGFETSTQAALQMDDAASGSLLAAGPVSSMFQTNNVALKMVLPASWVRRSASGVAYMTGVSW
jgi:hypothetical protein